MSKADGPTTVSGLRQLATCLEIADEHAGLPSALKMLDQCFQVLDAQAATATDFEVWRSRLCNARRYVLRHEAGAARFELRLLLQRVTPVAQLAKAD
jgi:hypothetical protein